MRDLRNYLKGYKRDLRSNVKGLNLIAYIKVYKIGLGYTALPEKA